jgi:hypothetical protein
MKSWKRHEKNVAEFFGGYRRYNLYRQGIGDIIHHKYSIECKYGKQVPKYCEVKSPTLINSQYALIPSKQFDSQQCFLLGKEIRSTIFLTKAMIQSVKYNKKKIPLVALKRRGQRGFTVVMQAYDYDLL